MSAELLALLDELDAAQMAWQEGSPGWSDQALDAMESLPKLTAALRAVEALADELEREAGERQRRAERTPGSAPFAADRIRLFAGARHQRLAAAQLRAAIAAALTPEQADR